MRITFDDGKIFEFKKLTLTEFTHVVNSATGSENLDNLVNLFFSEEIFKYLYVLRCFPSQRDTCVLKLEQFSEKLTCLENNHKYIRLMILYLKYYCYSNENYFSTSSCHNESLSQEFYDFLEEYPDMIYVKCFFYRKIWFDPFFLKELIPPLDYEDFYSMGLFYLYEYKRPDIAIRYFSLGLKANPKDIAILFDSGRAYLERKDYEKSGNYFKEVICLLDNKNFLNENEFKILFATQYLLFLSITQKGKITDAYESNLFLLEKSLDFYNDDTNYNFLKLLSSDEFPFEILKENRKKSNKSFLSKIYKRFFWVYDTLKNNEMAEYYRTLTIELLGL